MTLVLDASMTLAWLFERAQPAERELANRVFDVIAYAPALVPSLWRIEVANALLVGERRRLLSGSQSHDFLVCLDGLPITVDYDMSSGRRNEVMMLARGHNLTSYSLSVHQYINTAFRIRFRPPACGGR